MRTHAYRILSALLAALTIFASTTISAESADTLINNPPVGHDGKTVTQRLHDAGSTMGLSGSGYSQFMTKNTYDSYSYFPEVNGYAFDLFSGRISVGIEVGCNGISIDSLVDSLSGQFEYIIDYYTRNALGLAINYLIYSRPTLAALIDKLKAAFEYNLDHALWTCDKAKAMGAKKIKENTDNAAYNECLKDHPGNQGACLGESSAFGASLNSVFNRADAAISSTLSRFRVDRVLGKTDVAGSIACSGLLEYEMKIAEHLIPSKPLARDSDDVMLPTATVDSLVEDRTKMLKSKYDYMIRNYNSETWITSSEFVELAQFSEEVKLSGAEYRKLQVLKSRNNGEYTIRLHDFAQQNAIATVRRVIDKIDYGLSMCSEAMTENYPYEVQDKMRAVLPALQRMVDSKQKALEARRMAYQSLQKF